MGVVKKLHGGTFGPKLFPVNMLFLSPQTQGLMKIPKNVSSGGVHVDPHQPMA